MTKNSVQQFSTVPANNTDIAGTYVGPNWPPGNVGLAYRTLMAFIADSLVPLVVPLSGSTVTLTAAQASAQWISFTGALTTSCTVTLGGAFFMGFAQNNTTGGHGVVLAAAIPSVDATIPAGGAWFCYENNGADTISLVTLGSGGGGSVTAAAILALDFSAMPTTDPGAGKFWLNGNVVSMGTST